LLERQVAGLVDDDQAVAAQPGQFPWQVAVPMGAGQAGDPVGRGGEQDPVAVPRRGDPEGDRQMRLAGSRRYPRFWLVRAMFLQVMLLLRLK
jgi:hypothetical protein